MLKVNLQEMGWEQPSEELEVTITSTPQGIVIRPKGYGDATSEDGKGAPILIELFEGHPRVTIWDDINNEDSSHTISLANALEMDRVDEDEEEVARQKRAWDSLQFDV